jgi:lysophospholipase L1-like esterase
MVCALLEIGARLYAKATLQQRGLRYHSELGWVPLPNVRKVGRYWGDDEPGWTNSHGFRDAEHPYEKPRGVRRVVAVGDSYTFGVSVDYGERYTELLEEKLDGWEVVNLGVNAYGTDQELIMLEVEGLRYEPDISICLIFLGNDLNDISYENRFWWPKPYFELTGEQLVHRRPRPTLETRIRSTSYLGEFVMRATERWRTHSVLAPGWQPENATPLFAALVKKMAEVSRSRGIAQLFVLAYPFGRTPDTLTGTETAAREVFATAGVEYLDLLDRFVEKDRLGENVWAFDHHWNVHGHELVASAIRDRLEELGWLRGTLKPSTKP